MNASIQRREVFFNGMVQGVGFRYTARQIAQQFSVTGYVQNTADGRVRTVVEGTSDEIDRFLAAIHAELGRYVTGTEHQVLPPLGEPQSFEIRF